MGRKLRLSIPLIAWLLYSSSIVLLFLAGPFIYDNPSGPLLIAYIIVAHIAIALGYVRGLDRPTIVSFAPAVGERIGWGLAGIAVVGMVISLVGDLSSGLSYANAIQDPNGSRNIWVNERTGTLTMYVFVALSASYFPLISLVICRWRETRRGLRWIAVLVALSICFSAFLGGSRASIFAVICIVVLSIVTGKESGMITVGWRPMALSVCALTACFLLYSSFISVNRRVDPNYDFVSFLRDQSDVRVDVDKLAVFSVLPPSIQPGVLTGIYYITQGYEGLAICLSKPFVGIGYGAGHSRFLTRTVARVLKDDAFNDRSYFDRIIDEDGFSPSRWVTMFPWIASDVTFIGSIAVLYMLGWCTGAAYVDVLFRGNPYATCVLGWMFYTLATVSMTFPPGDYGALLSFYGSLGVWFSTRTRHSEKASRFAVG